MGIIKKYHDKIWTLQFLAALYNSIYIYIYGLFLILQDLSVNVILTYCLFSVAPVNFPVKNLELKDYIPLPMPKGNEKLRSKYDLIANIVHDGKPGEGCYRVFVQRKSEEQWFYSFLLDLILVYYMLFL
jgi:hypothetical protein